jgi:hypothetical protein
VSKVNVRDRNVTPLLRTERERRCVQSTRDEVPMRTDDPSENRPVMQSLRTERATTASSPLGPDGASRVLTAGLLNTALAERWEAGEEWASNRCLAERYCGLTESVVRRWRDGDKLVPLAALHVLPAPLAEQLARGVLRARGVTLRQAMGSLRGAVDNIESPVAPADREEVMRTLIEAQRRISERLARLATEGR